MAMASAAPEQASGTGVGLTLTPRLIEDALSTLRNKQRSDETVQTYRARLRRFYDWLPQDKRVLPGTLERWRESLLDEGYAPRTVNLSVSAVNTLLELCGRRELQIGEPLPPGEESPPELSRDEYLRLLTTARALGKEREYLLVKVFAATGLRVQELCQVTAEAALTGTISLPDGTAHLPECLRRELSRYAQSQGISSGPIFRNRKGLPCPRTAVTGMIQRLGRDAGVAEEKCTPRCLRKLYQATLADINSTLDLLIEQSHDRLLEAEQRSIGWSQGGASDG